MAIFTDLQEAIRLSVIAALPDYPTTLVKFSHDNGPEPSSSYVVINVLNIEQQGHHSTSTRLSETTETQTVQASYEVMVQFSFIGSLSGDMSQSFTQRINNNYLVFEELGRNKLGVMRKSPIRRAPQKRDTKWVEYHNMDVTFSYTICTTQVVDIIEAVIIENQTEPSIFRVPEGLIPPY